ncbi:MAG: UDP-N-acetylmuramoyl-L-alanyl-D-glutamate--2,6-diaminopimelate ligase [Acidobacteriota bacterium]|nr:MAG: UDP-N-acetylmuramoyl-L-alanyl-D-glutamate--2,6-diaminopimelate ligase [Acidobacteriota bacterium]
MRLQKLLSELPTGQLVDLKANSDLEISSLAYDSRQVESGSLFFAIEGHAFDGHAFIDQALANGAVAVVSERPSPVEFERQWVQVRSIRQVMALGADRFMGSPSQQITMIGVTGTNGKTTTAYLCHSILSQMKPALMLGSIRTYIGERVVDSKLTTPESVEIQSLLTEGVRAGCRTGVMEVSSHALALDRTFGSLFPVAVFTNLTQDHLDFHGDFNDYFSAKKRLFDKRYNPGLKWAVLNADDPYGRQLAVEANGDAITYGIDSPADVRPESLRLSKEGVEATINLLGNSLEISCSLIGRHNLYNLLAATAACSLLGCSNEIIQQGLRSIQSVPGRFEKVECDAPATVVIDFAHTPDALSNVLDLAREVAAERVICLFGCGGDRDRKKRPLMGEVATRKADLSIVTSDNPRTEDPDAIIYDILEGIPQDARPFEVITDRREAIRRALQLSRPGDLVLLAGKGHETYQDIGGRKVDFDERHIVREALCST